MWWSGFYSCFRTLRSYWVAAVLRAMGLCPSRRLHTAHDMLATPVRHRGYLGLKPRLSATRRQCSHVIAAIACCFRGRTLRRVMCSQFLLVTVGDRTLCYYHCRHAWLWCHVIAVIACGCRGPDSFALLSPEVWSTCARHH